MIWVISIVYIITLIAFYKSRKSYSEKFNREIKELETEIEILYRKITLKAYEKPEKDKPATTGYFLGWGEVELKEAFEMLLEHFGLKLYSVPYWERRRIKKVSLVEIEEE